MKRVTLALVLAGTALAAQPARAQIAVGPQVVWGDQRDLGVGGRLILALTSGIVRIEGLTAVDWFLDCEQCSYFEVTPAAALAFSFLGIGAHAGAGVNVARSSIRDPAGGPATNETELGLALLLGARIPFGLFGEVRKTSGGAGQTVFTLGFRLGG